MNRVKLNLFIDKIKENKEITFRLYNAYYIIKYINKKYTINQIGIDKIYTYDSITVLFENYLVYGNNLKDLFNDIKIIK